MRLRFQQMRKSRFGDRKAEKTAEPVSQKLAQLRDQDLSRRRIRLSSRLQPTSLHRYRSIASASYGWLRRGWQSLRREAPCVLCSIEAHLRSSGGRISFV